MSNVGIRFGECELTVERFELRRAEQVVAIEPQVFDVLSYLLRHRERVVPKTELLDEVWGDRFVSYSALTSRSKSARRAIECLRQGGTAVATANLVLNGTQSVLASTGEEIIDLLKGGQGVLNIVPMAGVVSELDAAIHELHGSASDDDSTEADPAAPPARSKAASGG